MKKIWLVTAALVLFQASTFAQRMGSGNSNAPTIKQNIEFADGAKVSFHYVAINWGGGQWAKALANEESRDKMRERINSTAKSRPLASMETSMDMLLGEQSIPAGAYQVGFTLNEKFAWQMSLMKDEATIHLPLPLMDSPEEAKRLIVAAYADNAAGSVGMYVSFGKKFCTLTLLPAKGA